MLKRDFSTYVSFEYSKIFKNSFSYKTPPVVAFNESNINSFQPNAAFHIKKTVILLSFRNQSFNLLLKISFLTISGEL